MNFRSTLFALAALPLTVLAQQDSTAERHSHVLTIGSNGVKVPPIDTTLKPDDPDTLRITTRRKLIRIITTLRDDIDSTRREEDRLEDARRERRNLFTYWSGLDIGINTFITEDGRFGDGPKSGPLQLNNSISRFFAINVMEQKVEFGSHRAGLLTGLGLEFLSYKLSGNVTLAYNGDSTYAIPTEDPEFRKNKLRQIGVRVPLLFEFNTKKAPLPSTPEEWAAYEQDGFSRKGNFHIAFGLIGSYYFDTMYKQRFSEGGEIKKTRVKADYNLLPYRVAATVRIGIGGLNLFAEYGLTPMFEDGTAPALASFNAGLTLIGFN